MHRLLALASLILGGKHAFAVSPRRTNLPPSGAQRGTDIEDRLAGQHLANASKFGHIRRVNTLLGLPVPLLVTPLALLGETL
jgi:hypothetical protein